ELAQNSDASARIARCDHVRNTPELLDRRARFGDGKQRVIERARVARALPNRHVGEQKEKRTAPISAAPGVSALEPAIARLGQTLRQTVDQIAPEFLRSDQADTHARYGFEIRREPFSEPGVRAVYVRKIHVDELVRHDPIVARVCGSDS